MPRLPILNAVVREPDEMEKVVSALWSVERLVEVGVFDRQVADLVERLVFSADVENAGRLASVIESKVASPGVGLVPAASGVVVAVIAGLPVMDVSVRRFGVGLLSQVAGWLLSTGVGVEHESVGALMGALPGVAALAQIGDDDLQAEFVDFAALCAALDPSVVEQVAFYLRCVVDEVGGDIGASAQIELEQLAR